MIQLIFKTEVYGPTTDYVSISSETKVAINERDKDAISAVTCKVLSEYVTQAQLGVIVNTLLRELSATRISSMRSKELFYNGDGIRSVSISAKRIC